ncbi:carbon-nitrogen hydrolase [Microdochium bolleyi]|uniref:Carbon-nitrogen hydrolase n=1 Tax=Microdochium bolleyi TaxID=196109 RepID=A0A136IRB0_9PEZI|nr:carbon-nitrogen hydrolase [Microdochium bolleyi]
MTPIRVAACHLAPVFLDAAATTRKALDAIHTAARHGAGLVVFPETYIPAFPLWSALRAPYENHDLFRRMARESVFADGDEIKSIQHAAKELGIAVSIGISEKVRYSSATLFNANLLIGGPDGRVLNHHRKLMPTFFEKLTWAHGDGHGLRVVDLPSSPSSSSSSSQSLSGVKVGNLICGENTNPLARYALMSQGEQLHISTWPATWPTRIPESVTDQKQEDEGIETAPTATTAKNKGGRGRNYDNVAANRTRAAAHCFEAKCFGVLCSGFLDERAIEIVSEGAAASPQLVRDALRASPRGVTMFLDPTGAAVAGFTMRKADAGGRVGEEEEQQQSVDYLQNEEGILFADLDMEECVEGKQYHDVVGGYQRHDVFQLSVRRERERPVRFLDPPEVPDRVQATAAGASAVDEAQ